MDDSTPQRFEIGDSVLFQKLHDEVVLLNMADQNYYGLDDVASKMWEILLDRGTVDGAVSELMTIYNTDEETLRRDLANLVRDLVAAHLLKVSGSTASA